MSSMRNCSGFRWSSDGDGGAADGENRCCSAHCPILDCSDHNRHRDVSCCSRCSNFCPTALWHRRTGRHSDRWTQWRPLDGRRKKTEVNFNGSHPLRCYFNDQPVQHRGRPAASAMVSEQNGRQPTWLNSKSSAYKSISCPSLAILLASPSLSWSHELNLST